jgi:hypothetical protein
VVGLVLATSVSLAGIIKIRAADANCAMTPVTDEAAMFSGSRSEVMKDGHRMFLTWLQRAVPTGFPSVLRVSVQNPEFRNWEPIYLMEHSDDRLWRRITVNTCED